MGQEQGKYHISKDGKVYRINEDGTFTELGNAEDLTKPKNNIVTNNKKHPKQIKWKLIACGIILILAGVVFLPHLLTQIYENDNVMDYVDDSSSTDFVSGNLDLDNDSCVVVYRGYYNDNLYCNGIYEPESSRQCLDVNLEKEYQFNRYHFSIQLNYYPANTGTIIVLSDGWRVLKLFITEDWKVGVSTNNGDHYYSTDINVSQNAWNSIDAEYYHGQMSLNGYICRNVTIDMDNGDNYLSSIDFSCGQCFNGWLSNIEVISFCTR